MEPHVIRTPCLELSAPHDGDVAAIHEACQDAAIQRFTTVPSPYLREDAEGFVALTRRWWEEGTQAHWSIRLDGTFAGMIGLAKLDGGAPEIGYWIAPSARGAGVATEAATAVVGWAFELPRPRVERIEWRAVVGNLGSARVARRLGFRYEGLLRHAHRNDLGRADAWIGGLLRTDAREPQPWPVEGG